MTNSATIRTRVLDAIRDTANLPVGWNYGRGRPSTSEARANAILVATLLAVTGSDDVAIFPDTDGAILVSGYRGRESFEILACSGAGFEVMFEVDGVEGPVEHVATFADVQKRVGDRGWQGKSTSASFHQNIMTFGSNGTSGSPSRIQPVGEYPSSTWIAQSGLLVTYVATSASSIHDVFTVHRQLSGVSTQPRLLHRQGLSNQRRRPETHAITISSA